MKQIFHSSLRMIEMCILAPPTFMNCVYVIGSFGAVNVVWYLKRLAWTASFPNPIDADQRPTVKISEYTVLNQ